MNNASNWFLQTSDYLNKLSVPDRGALLQISEEHHFDKAEMIFNAGTDSEYVYILRTGKVKIYELSSDGKEIILWFCFPGEVFGLSEITLGADRSVYAQACSESEIKMIKREIFNRFLREHPDAAMLIIDLLSCRLRGLSSMLTNLSADDVTSRLIKLLIRMSMLYGIQSRDVLCLNIELTHQDIADMIGSSRQTVCSIIGQLKRNGILIVDRDGIQIQKSNLPEQYFKT